MFPQLDIIETSTGCFTMSATVKYFKATFSVPPQDVSELFTINYTI